MLRAGLVRQTAAGIYAWLPLGFRVLKKIEQIVREEQDRAGAVLLLADDLLDFLEHAKAERQPGVNPRRRLAHEAGPQHQLVADDLGVGGALLENRQKSFGPAPGGGRQRPLLTTGNRRAKWWAMWPHRHRAVTKANRGDLQP